MTKKQSLVLFFIALIVSITVAAQLDVPGYMDADYYFSGGMSLAEGEGFSEMILWNFLDDPQGLPHRSHTYWMPLTSIIASFGIFLAPFLSNFKAAQLGFILFSIAIPFATAQLSYQFFQDKSKAFFAGLLSIFSGFYFAFTTTTDAFAIYMLLGGAFFLLLPRLEKKGHFITLGLLAGLMHMARADGLIWLLVAFTAIWIKRKEINIYKSSSLLILGYLLVSFPWLWRNWQQTGSVLAQGGYRSLYLLSYDELFSFPASLLSFEHFRSVGIWDILQTRWEAVFSNLQTGFAVQGLIFLGPLALFSAWKKRKDIRIQVGWIAWVLTFIMMSILFPFSGARGGFFHSGAAFMPLIWALSLDGLDSFITWLGQKRSWKITEAILVFRYGLIALAFLVSSYLTFQKIPTWSLIYDSYSVVESHLVKLGAKKEDVVLVNNPPSYYASTHRAAIVIPNGAPSTIIELLKNYDAEYLILELNHPEALDALYQDPQSQKGLIYLETVWDRDPEDQEDYFGTHLFKVGNNDQP